MSSGIGSEADFRPLISVLQKIQAEGHQDFSDQLAAFERETLSYELDPSCFNWVELNYALGTAVAFAEALQAREWTPGREDLTPLFDISELAAS
jgi:hypothetical protein